MVAGTVDERSSWVVKKLGTHLVKRRLLRLGSLDFERFEYAFWGLHSCFLAFFLFRFRFDDESWVFWEFYGLVQRREEVQGPAEAERRYLGV